MRKLYFMLALVFTAGAVASNISEGLSTLSWIIMACAAIFWFVFGVTQWQVARYGN
jgi:heme/copper-type cytochrome/quinol oxidase subunit 2